MRPRTQGSLDGPAVTSSLRATSRVGKAALLLFSFAVLPAGGELAVRAQSAFDGFDPSANGAVNVVVVQSDGKILIGGDFTAVSPNGGAAVTRNHIARLKPDGTLDTAFNPNANGTVNVIALQGGQILVGGSFTTLSPNGGAAVTRNRIARLNPDGTLDTAFNPNASSTVFAIAMQGSKIIVGGTFTTLSPNGGGTLTCNRIARLNPDGTLDTTFDRNASSSVFAIAVQGGGKVLVGGAFTSIGGQSRNRIARLDPTTGLADSLNPNANRPVSSIAVQADGKILAGGGFTSIGGQPRSLIARLDATTGLADSFSPTANGTGVGAIAVELNGKILIGGDFTALSPNGGATVTRNHIARLKPDGTLDTAFNPNTNGNAVFSIAAQQDNKILIGGNFTTVRSEVRNRIARLEIDGRLDQTLDFGNPAGPGIVYATAVQPDGKILIGGGFTTVGGLTRNNIARLNTDGTVDTLFDPNANDTVYSIAVQADGKIVVGGSFTTLAPNGGATVTRNRMARLNPVGTLDTAFNPNANNVVGEILVQADGKILAGGAFTSIGGQVRHFIARLDATNGKADSLNPRPTDVVSGIAVESGGTILIGGHWDFITGSAIRNFARLNPDGTLDTTFNAHAEGSVEAIALQTDKKILVGGGFNGAICMGGQTRDRIARLDPITGFADSFDPDADTPELSTVHSIAVQADGEVLIGGSFVTLSPNGGARVTVNGIARLDPDGTLNTAFDPNAGESSFLESIAVNADGKILVGGGFNIGGQARRLFARLSNDTAALQNLAVAQDIITWTRGGASPQFARVTFESSTDGVNYTSLGNGTAVGSDWTLRRLNLPIGQSLFIRARGFYRSGRNNGSESIAESVRNVVVSGSTGRFDLNPGEARVRVGETVPYSVLWTVPAGEVWRDLSTIDFRVRGCGQTQLWVRWDEPNNTLSLCDSTDSCGPGVLPGSPVVLETESAALHLADSTVVGSGPTGTSVTVNLAVSFKNACGSSIEELAATDDFGHQDDFVVAGELKVLGGGQHH